ncbi:MAG TPA: hypothetical protein VEY10_19160 [Flavisolibacter sp.]|jgi:hypothetical protein|nr:hypothetical protein [Flavisolibacter sp.]
MSLQATLKHYRLIICLAILPTISTEAQTEFDAIMMNKNQFCSGFMYMHSSWSNYWEGTLKRTNENLGTVTTQSVMYMANYGITDKLNVMAGAPYVSTKASAGTMAGMRGVQDVSLFVKYIPFQKKLGKGQLTTYALGGFSTPITDYVVDFLPLSIGLGSTNFTGRVMVDYNCNRLTLTGSAAYIRRSNVRLDRTSYYDTQIHLTNEVKMPNAAQYQLRTGYRGKYLIAEALLTNWTTLGGFDMTRNNMPFPSNRMNATAVGINLKYTVRAHTNLSLFGGATTTLNGRNMGQANALNAGAFYAFYITKKASTKK